MGRTWACSFHGNSMNNLLSCCGLIDAKIRASNKDLPVPYVRYHNPLSIRNRSLILIIHKVRIFPKKLLGNKEMNFKNGVINIQTVGYNVARTVFELCQNNANSEQI